MGQADSKLDDVIPDCTKSDPFSIHIQEREWQRLTKQTMPWKLNCFQLSNDGKYVFVAYVNKIDVFEIQENNSLLLVAVLSPVCHPTSLPLGQESEISQIKSMEIADEFVLVSVCDNGNVCIWMQDDLTRPPIVINNEQSTWSLTCCPTDSKLYVGSNAWTVTSYDLDAKGSIEAEKQVFQGHQHNVPCCDISPCGSFLASVSVDSSAIIWNAKTAEKLSQISLPGGWGWACKWIKKKDIGILMPPDSLSSMFDILSGSEQNQLSEAVKKARPESEVSESSCLIDESQRPRNPADFVFFAREDIEDDYLNDDDVFEEEEEEEDQMEEIQVAQDIMFVVPPNNQATTEEATSASQREKGIQVKRVFGSSPPQAPFLGFNDKKREELSKSNTEQPPAPSLTEYVVVCASFNDIIIYEPSTKIISGQLSAVLPHFPMTSNILRMMERLSMMEYIPELSLLIVASQGACSVLLISLVRDLSSGIYELRPIQRPKSRQLRSPIVGMSLSRCPNGDVPTWRLWILFHSGEIITIDISRA